MRAACWTCRSRTIQCDQTSFPCAKCEKAGLECFDKRPLRWVKGVAIRGKMRGRVLGVNPKASNEYPCPKSKRKQLSHLSATSLAINPTPKFALQDPCVHDLDWSSRFYLDYYNVRIAKLFILYDSENNPFRNLLTYATESLTLRKSIIAVAARHFANAGRSFHQIEDALSPRYVSANLDALHFKRQTIQALSSSLSHPEESRKDETIATILLLIFLDLLESGIDGWKYHLRGAEGLLSLSHALLESGAGENYRTGPSQATDETSRFFARQFALVSTMGGTLSSSTSSSGLCANLEESKHQESIIRSFLGCPGFLLQAIRYFSNQRHARTDTRDEASIHEHCQDTLTMLELTNNFDCLNWASSFLQSTATPTVEIQKLSLLSQAYKVAAVLYANRVLCALKTPTLTKTFDNEALVSQLLDVIESLKGDEALFKCLLWPIFIAGLECQGDNEQTLVIDSLKLLWDVTCCLNIISASRILHEYWKRKHFDGILVPQESDDYMIEEGWLLI
ncbi:hypothetical protein N7451_011649 [Penicillium sp. IBT 35674x]|nr:hypothetical protein N7451_011649 [Penicillium sp. IBT 35674x]